MASIYDKINTAKELLTEVSIHGLSTKVEDICRAQDIFGHTAIEDLVALANDNGMNGSMSTGRRGTQALFYQVAFAIWHWEDATRFYNQHTNKEFIAGREAADKLRAEMREHAETKKNLETALQNARTLNSQIADLQKQIQKMKESGDADKLAIMELKSKLYDLMMEKEGK